MFATASTEGAGAADEGDVRDAAAGEILLRPVRHTTRLHDVERRMVDRGEDRAGKRIRELGAGGEVGAGADVNASALISCEVS